MPKPVQAHGSRQLLAALGMVLIGAAILYGLVRPTLWSAMDSATWADFLSNLVATTTGVFLALALEHRIEGRRAAQIRRQTDQRQHAGQEALVGNVLQIGNHAVHNLEFDHKSGPNHGRFARTVALGNLVNAGHWHNMADEYRRLCSDVAQLNALWSFYSDVDRLARLADEAESGGPLDPNIEARFVDVQFRLTGIITDAWSIGKTWGSESQKAAARSLLSRAQALGRTL